MAAHSSLKSDSFRLVFRQTAWAAAVVIVPLSAGCAINDSGMMHESLRIFKPRVSDYRDESQEVDEEWDSVGKAARSNRPLESQNDPIRDLLWSPRAKSIERSLGYE